jgi:hypothetical protein
VAPGATSGGEDAVARLDELLSEYTDEIHALMCEVMGMVAVRIAVMVDRLRR